MPGGLHPPIDVIETWKFNYVDPETGGFYIVILVGVLLGLSYLAVFMRLVARLYLQKNFGIDDGLIVFNMVSPFPKHLPCAPRVLAPTHADDA
jgi:hypothetical protein